jgi:protease YdgD
MKLYFFATLLTTIGLAATMITPAIAQVPSLTIASDKAISNRPNSNQPFLPKGLDQDIPSGGTRGVICKPSQKKDCDDRVPMLSNDHPWSAIGRLMIGDSGHCTATLIDREWVLTNAHCVIDSETHKLAANEFTFSPNLINGKLQSAEDAAKVVDIIIGTDFTDSQSIPHPNDWAMLKLDKPLGEKYGTIGWRVLPSSILIKNRRKFTLAGYSWDFPSIEKYPSLDQGAGLTAGLHKGCSVTAERPDKALVHDCDMRGGASGSAIITWIDNKPYIVAINNAERTVRKTGEGIENYAVNVNRIVEWFERQNAK